MMSETFASSNMCPLSISSLATVWRSRPLCQSVGSGTEVARQYGLIPLLLGHILISLIALNWCPAAANRIISRGIYMV